MNKTTKKIVYLMSLFILLTIVFFFGLRFLLNTFEQIKMPSLNQDTSISDEEERQAEPIALGGEMQQEAEEEQEQSSSLSLSSFTTQPDMINTKKLLGLSLLIAAFFTYKAMIDYDMRHGLEDLKGEERWAKRRELKKAYITCRESEIPELTKAGTPIAHYTDTYYIEPKVKHNLIIGTTGSGKTQTHVLHSIKLIAQSKDKQNFIVNDPKGEILSDTYTILAEEGYDIVIFNLKDAEVSSGWNPLTFVVNEYKRCRKNNKDLSKVAEYVDTICHSLTWNNKSEPIWPSSAKSLLSAMILYLIETAYEYDTENEKAISEGTLDSRLDKVTFYSVFQLFSHFGGEDAYRDTGNGYTKKLNALDELFKTLPVTSLASAAYTTSRFAEGDMRGSIYATLADNINIFGRDLGIAKITSHTNIDFDGLIEKSYYKPFAVYMLLPDDRPSRYVLASLFINQAYLSIIEYLGRRREQTLPRRVNFILDEFANMPKISGMDNKITVSRSRNVQWWLYVQGLSQLDSKYDKSAKTIRENCPNLIYIYSGDDDTNSYIEKLLGSSTLQYHTYSGKLSEELSRSQQYEAKPLKNINQLRRLQMGETITISHRQRPILSKFDFYYKLNIEKTDIDALFENNENFDLNTTLYPLTDFTSILPSEFIEFKERIAADSIYSGEQNNTSDEEAAESSSDQSGGNVVFEGFGGGVSNIIVNTDSDDSQVITEYNPMDNISGSAQEEQRSDSILSILEAAQNSLNTQISAENIVEQVDKYTSGKLSEALNSGQYSRATAELKRLKAKSRLTIEQEQILTDFIRSKSGQGEQPQARKK